MWCWSFGTVVLLSRSIFAQEVLVPLLRSYYLCSTALPGGTDIALDVGTASGDYNRPACINSF